MGYDKEKYIEWRIKQKRKKINDAIENGVLHTNGDNAWIVHKGKKISMMESSKHIAKSNLYSGNIAPWEFATFIECIE